jgi:DNA replication protein DnaC
MKQASQPVRQRAIQQYRKQPRAPTMGTQFVRLAETAANKRRSHLDYLEALLQAEVEDRERHAIERRIREARPPKVTTPAEFSFASAPHISVSKLKELAEGSYITKAEPILLIGDSGAGKTHLLTALCVAACRRKKRARFTTAAGLVNDLVEAQHRRALGRAPKRRSRYDAIGIDEVGYAPMAEVGAEYPFQVIADRAEKAAAILTTNLPFSEWTKVMPDTRLCKAPIDRLTGQARIVETGQDSYRFQRTAKKRQQSAT